MNFIQLYSIFLSFKGVQKQEGNKSTNSKPNITAADACDQVEGAPGSSKVQIDPVVDSSQVEGEPSAKKPKITPARASDQDGAAPDITKLNPTVAGNSGVKATITPAGENGRVTDEKSKTLRNKEKRMRSKNKKSGGDRKRAKRIICEVCGTITTSLDNYERHIKTNHSKNLEDMSAKAFKSKYS